MILRYTYEEQKQTKKIAVCPHNNDFSLPGSFLGSEIRYKKDGYGKYHKHYLKEFRNIIVIYK